jgi:hypothetical protein
MYALEKDSRKSYRGYEYKYVRDAKRRGVQLVVHNNRNRRQRFLYPTISVLQIQEKRGDIGWISLELLDVHLDLLANFSKYLTMHSTDITGARIL